MLSISVVIPARNDAVMLEACLAALAHQSRPADEIVVVDNGSTDDTAEVARRAGATVIFEPVTGILHATVAGFDYVAGTGARANADARAGTEPSARIDDVVGTSAGSRAAAPTARADIMARIDADSIPRPDWLAEIERAFTADPGLTGVTGPGEYYGGNAAVRWAGETFYLGGYFVAVRALMGHVPLFGSNLALRSIAWSRIKPGLHIDNPRMHDDFDISMRLTPAMRVRFVEELRMPISARPFDSLAGFGRRLDWAFATLAVNWAEERPWSRVAKRVAAGRRRAHVEHPGRIVPGAERPEAQARAFISGASAVVCDENRRAKARGQRKGAASERGAAQPPVRLRSNRSSKSNVSSYGASSQGL